MATISEYLRDEVTREAAFPIVADTIYLAHAAVCPLPRRVSMAMTGLANRSNHTDQETAAGQTIAQTRQLVASFLGVPVGEVALLGSTSNALSLIAAGFPTQPGDNVVIYREDYPSNVYPWMAMSDRGVEVRSVAPDRLGQIQVDHVLQQIDSRTRLVALSSCHYLAGHRLALDEIGGALHERGIAFAVDGIQSLGAFPMSLTEVDFMAADAHKWLLGPCAAGVLYVRGEWQGRLSPNTWGWHNVACPNYLAADQLEFVNSAERYEPGTANLIGLAGLSAAFELLSEIGPSAISEALVERRAFLIEQLLRRDYQVLGELRESTYWGGMVSATRPDLDMEQVHRELAEAGVRASVRPTRDGRAWLRFSPHCYNTLGELEQAVSLLK